MSKLNVNIGPNDMQPISCKECNGLYFRQVMAINKVSKFLTGSTEDAIMPVPCFYDVATGKVLVELLPKEVREEYDNI